MKCLNCGNEFEGNYCPECGQSAETGRFTMKFIFENLAAAIISRDGSIWFTLKNLFTRPGSMITDILGGKRKKYFSPFPMLFFALTLYILITSVTTGFMIQEAFKDSDVVFSGQSEEISPQAAEVYNAFKQTVSFFHPPLYLMLLDDTAVDSGCRPSLLWPGQPKTVLLG